ncbi:hypothetical protein QBC47DRAFT_358102 [Echria macrotheca]|uniref:NADH-ubiquinone oxidoreductase 17.8 kDa subunit n=1 Tax=Echria macrotheca TaxID=438768 RepID=A0AAJ0BH80_9PEZI|nr:hypothetical protein QBC47DRAFT_358102 [Echria macrotheca]
MQAFRQRGLTAARQARPRCVRNTRSYASGHGHGHHAEHTVEESFGTSFYVAIAAIPASYLVYTASRPGKDGEPTAISKWLEKTMDLGKEWERRNHNNTAAIEQAARDKHLFLNAPRNRHIELTYPEVFQHGSPYNVPAGHYINLDKVVAHYHKQHLDEEARKAKKLAAKSE